MPRRALALLLAACTGCAPRTWCVPTTCATRPDAPPKTSCVTEPNFLCVDSHSNIPPGAIPPPNGTYLYAWERSMAGAAAADRFVIYLNEWYMGGPELGPEGHDHLAAIAKQLPEVAFPVVVQPCGDDLVNQMHRQLVVHVLFDHGIADAEMRVIVACPKAEGLNGAEALQINQRMQSGGQGGGTSGVGGGSPVSGFQGSFMGGLGGGFSF